jgi:F420-0:gamma-glutamyl ligase-like protein
VLEALVAGAEDDDARRRRSAGTDLAGAPGAITGFFPLNTAPDALARRLAKGLARRPGQPAAVATRLGRRGLHRR